MDDLSTVATGTTPAGLLQTSMEIWIYLNQRCLTSRMLQYAAVCYKERCARGIFWKSSSLPPSILSHVHSFVLDTFFEHSFPSKQTGSVTCFINPLLPHSINFQHSQHEGRPLSLRSCSSEQPRSRPGNSAFGQSCISFVVIGIVDAFWRPGIPFSPAF
jgi:hypothetical protein